MIPYFDQNYDGNDDGRAGESNLFYLHFRNSNQHFDLGDFEQKKEGTHQKGHGDFSPDWRASHSDNF